MARKPRIHYPGAAYHVILRGNAGQPIFVDDEDRSRLYRLLREGVERFGHRIHAFCLMNNHVHLALQVGDIALSRIMQNLSFRYTRSMNWRHKRTGHLFQGRYRAVLIDADSYLLQLIRYIHLNPVRARLAATPEEYRWTSHGAYLGKESIPWLTTDWALSMFSEKEGLARRRYQQFLHEAAYDAIKPEFRLGNIEGRILGDDSFAEEALRKSGEPLMVRSSVDDVLAVVSAHYGMTVKDMAASGKGRREAEARAMAALIVRETPGLSLSELSKRVNRDLSALSWGAKRITARMGKDKQLAATVRKLLSRKQHSISQA
jgi:putative transposase